MNGIVVRSLAIAALAGFATGCQGTRSITSGGSQKPADWAMDACNTFPKEAASKVAGFAVAKADSSGQTGTPDTLLSNCTYSSADGKTNFGILLRQEKSGGEPIAAQITDLKSRPDMTGPSEDVPMSKGRAIWSTKMHTLSYVPSDDRMIVVTPPGAILLGTPASPVGDLKAKAVAIAIAIEG